MQPAAITHYNPGALILSVMACQFREDTCKPSISVQIFNLIACPLAKSFVRLFAFTAGWPSDPARQKTEGEPIHTKQPSFCGQHPEEQEQGRYYARILQSSW